MYKVLIIGAGQLGARHLQGVLKSKHSLKITVFDTSIMSLKNAQNRQREVVAGNVDSTVSYTMTMPIHDDFYLAIIATTAEVRAAVTLELLHKNKIKHIIFEKVLFQKLSDYGTVQTKLNEHQTQGWVNCPRRIHPTYQKIKEMILGEEYVDIEVVGGGWGLACNSVHFMDLYAYLTKVTDFELSVSGLDRNVLQSKRNGFYETNGKLHGKTTKGEFRFTCEEKPTVSFSINIKTPNYTIDINEIEGFCCYRRDDNAVDIEHKTLFQSQLSCLNVDELILSETSSLTSFEEACFIHIPMIEAMQTHFELSLGRSLNACPIT